MEKGILKTGIVTLSILLLQGCAHGAVSRALNRKLAQEPALQNRSELQAQANAVIARDSALTPEQRSRLQMLGASVSQEVDQIIQQSLKLRSVLIQDVISNNYDMDEINLIRTRLRKLEDQRISLTFRAINQANEILGRDQPNKNALIHDYLNFELPRGRS